MAVEVGTRGIVVTSRMFKTVVGSLLEEIS